ncbi:LolA family protein [Dyadobacter pollutisoli]|jgi:outer membrane lipoprotein-sorting protein|uniref:Outer membrane lipoprotein carrier protein LolA n=1 Tax=Dyadobacter pollutisoli TaxID=2910158 RepID=A0A9E8SIL4_9BACT|nr:outer membrane lipoprotein carrier protein LolA [Dyadobacter pollutisoli]WAC10335.1 outer membrane lipoprotein carrier protein LolA [Dyadobacter pollutisoli]
MKNLKISNRWFFAIAMSLFTVVSVSAQGDKKSSAILEAMSDKYQKIKSFKAIFTYLPGGGKPLKGEATVKGTKFRLKMAGQEIFNDGKLMATYIKETNEVNLQDFDPAATGDLDPTKIYSAYKKGFKYVFLKERKEGNKSLEVVELTPTKKDSQISKVQIEVNKADKSINSWKIFQKNGQEVTYKVDQFQPDVNVADSYFAFNSKQYPGVEVVDLR